MSEVGQRKNGAGHNLAARNPVHQLREKHTHQLNELLRILRVYKRVVENNLERLDGAARLAAGDAGRRLAEWFEEVN